jgi:sensor histidine kinase YesM
MASPVVTRLRTWLPAVPVAFGIALATFLHAAAALDWIDAIVFAVPMGLLLGAIALSSGYFSRALPLARTPLTAILTVVTAAIITAALWSAVGRFWWHALAAGGLVSAAEPPPFLFALLVGLGALGYLLAVTTSSVTRALEDSAAAARRALELQIGQRDAELRALRAQVDPHFLFNSLHAIGGLIGADPARARLMCQLLGDFLRESLTVGSAPAIALEREVALANQYLQIEQVRFGSRLEVSAHVPPDAAGVCVPPLILQPLVENAVRHGVATTLEGGRVAIDARRAGSRMVVSVSNPRDRTAARRGTGFGLDLVRRRLEAAFGDRAGLTIEPGNDSYRVLITLPIEEATP